MSEKQPRILTYSEIANRLTTEYPYESVVDSATLRTFAIDLMHFSASDIVDEEGRRVIESYREAIKEVTPDLYTQTIIEVRKEMGELTNKIINAQKTGIDLEDQEKMQRSLLELRFAFPGAVPIRSVNNIVK